MSWRPSNALLWFGVGGGASAFVVQFVAGLAISYAECDRPGGGLSLRTWHVALAGAGLLVALASLAMAGLIFVRTFRIGDVFAEERRGDGHAPPLGRIHFLALVALTINLLIIPLIIMDGVGGGIHSFCQQT